MKPRTLFLLLVLAVAGLCIAGTKLSRITRTRSIQSNSLFLVSTQAADGHYSSRVITADDLGTNISQWVSGALGGNMVTMGAELFVDASTGSDLTGTRGRPDKPFATPGAAKAAAQEADAIIVRAGTYTGTGVSNLFKAGKLTWIFEDAILDYIDLCTNVTSGSGIFDDRFAGGACTNTVLGSIKIRYCSGTNIVYDELCNAFTVATNALGPIVVTNAASEIQWSAVADIRLWGLEPMPFALYIKNCRPLTYFKNWSLITNGAPSAQLSYSNCPAAPGVPIPKDVGCNFVYWELGTFSLDFDRAAGFNQYAFDCYATNTTAVGDMTVRGNFVDGKLYAVGGSTRWKIWAHILQWANSSANPSAINCYNSGSHYFNIQKVSSAVGAVIDLDNPTVSSDTNLNVWVDIEKVSGSNGWARVRHGALRGRIGHFDQNGPNDGTPQLLVTNISSMVALSGEDANAANTVLDHGGGLTELHGYKILSTNRDPIIVRSSGLRLDIASADTINGTNSIRAGTAQSVTLDRMYGGPIPHANVSFIGTNQAGNINALGLLSVVNAGISNSITTNSLTINAGISNAVVTNSLTINAGISNAVVTNLLVINAGISNSVSTNTLTVNAGISNLISTNLLNINAGISNATVTNTLVINAGISNLISTNLLNINAGISNATVTNTLVINAGISNLVGTNIAARLGAGTSNAMWTGGIFQDFTSYTNHSSASLNVTNLGTFTLPAHSLTNAGDQLRFYQSGRFQDALAMTNELWLRYGSITNIIDTGLQFASNTVYEVFATVTAINATKQRVEAKLRWGLVNSSAPGVPWTETNVVKFIAESNGVANTIGVYHAGQHAFTVTNESIIADWRKGYK